MYTHLALSPINTALSIAPSLIPFTPTFTLAYLIHTSNPQPHSRSPISYTLAIPLPLPQPQVSKATCPFVLEVSLHSDVAFPFTFDCFHAPLPPHSRFVWNVAFELILSRFIPESFPLLFGFINADTAPATSCNFPAVSSY